MKKKYSGILCHFTSLPSEYGAGDFGPCAYDFVDKLAQANQRLWQVLPIGNTDSSGCPYATDSAFGCAEFLVSPELLIKDMGLNPTVFLEFRSHSKKVDYQKLQENKRRILEYAYLNFVPDKKYAEFLLTEKDWIDDYAKFRALSEIRGGQWKDWGDSALTELEIELSCFHKFCQFIALDQFLRLKKYANKKKIKLIGDLPIFVSYNSMDVWKNPDQFLLNNRLEMEYETGAAPDAFSDKGQKWGTPIYNWELQKKEQFAWWNKRLSFLKRYFDIIRIDHFRGFCATWISKVSEPYATNGMWYKGPGEDLFKNLIEAPEIIAEDLGVITEDVDRLRDQFHFPTMKVFEFMSNDLNNPHNLNNYHFNSVAYSATHDCDTLMGWFKQLDKSSKQMIENEINIKNPDQWDMALVLLKSKSKMVLLQIQDVLGLSSKARFNYPGTVSDANWSWKLTTAEYKKIPWAKLKFVTKKARR